MRLKCIRLAGFKSFVDPIEVHVEPASGPPVRVSDAAFAAVAAAVWLAQGCPSDLPSGTHTLP